MVPSSQAPSPTSASSTLAPIKIYFDGGCYLCSHEMKHYYKLSDRLALQPFAFIDIAAPEFKAAEEGLDPQGVMAEMHVRDAHGKLHRGVDAFLVIWDALRIYRYLVPLARFPVIYQLLQIGYFIFAKIRRFLPKTNARWCTNGTCYTRVS